VSSNSERLAAARRLAENSGKSIGEILDAMAPTWGWSVFELAQAKHNAAAEVTPVSADEIAQRRNLVEQARQDREARLVREQLAAGERYLNAPNPHAAAMIMNADPFNTAEGLRMIREAKNNEPPPSAA
jgi:hypothetical protein